LTDFLLYFEEDFLSKLYGLLLICSRVECRFNLAKPLEYVPEKIQGDVSNLRSKVLSKVTRKNLHFVFQFSNFNREDAAFLGQFRTSLGSIS
jgi:hypothetical protein